MTHFLNFKRNRFGDLTPAAKSHGLWPWMNPPTFGRDVAPLGRQSGATSFARVAPHLETIWNLRFVIWNSILLGSIRELRAKNPHLVFNGSNSYQLDLFETTSVYNIHDEFFAGSWDSPYRRNRKEGRLNG